MPAKLRALNAPAPPAAREGAANDCSPVGEHDASAAWRVSVTGAAELKPRAHHCRTGSCTGLSRTLSGGIERVCSHKDFALLAEDEETGGGDAAPEADTSSEDADGVESANHVHTHGHGHNHGHNHAAAGPVAWRDVLLRVACIVRDRLCKSPLVQGSVAGVVLSLALKATDRKRKLPFIIDQTALYLHNCVLGVSLFNFGLFAQVNGMMPCGVRKTILIQFVRSVVCPLATLLVLLLFRFRGSELKLLVISAALPQALSSFVVFKEYKIQPEVFSTSMTVGTVLCLPVVCIWCAA